MVDVDVLVEEEVAATERLVSGTARDGLDDDGGVKSGDGTEWGLDECGDGRLGELGLSPC